MTLSSLELDAPKANRLPKVLKIAISLALLLMAMVLATFNGGFSDYIPQFAKFGIPILAAISASILVGFLLAVLRLKLIAGDLGYSLSFRQSIAAFSVGQVGGVLFFQIIGQLVARGAYLSGQGINIPMAGTILITGSERIAAAIVSGTLAISGAIYLFKGITLDVSLSPVRMIAGLLLVTIVCGFMYRRAVVATLAKLDAGHVRRFARAIAMSFLIQMPMMAAYILAARTIMPSASVSDVAAASTLVMFAASIPISFAGWGVRELSAVAALSAIGIEKDGAFIVALLIGIISLLVAFVFAGTTAGMRTIQSTTKNLPDDHAKFHKHENVLIKLLPILTAALIFFHVKIPTGRALINVNLADPLVVLGGMFSLFLLIKGKAPKWRLSGIELHFAACTAAMTFALLLGAYRIGWTNWAILNKYVGWFVLMATFATGALSYSIPLERFLRTFLLAGCTVVSFEMATQFAADMLALHPFDAVGFTQNRNAFAFQCLMMLCGAIALPNRNTLFISVAIAGLWLSASRAGIGAGAAIVLLSAAAFPGFFRKAVDATIVAVVLIALQQTAPYVLPVSQQIIAAVRTALDIESTNPEASGASAVVNSTLSRLMISPGSDASLSDHVTNIVAAWRMFLDHPIFGAGLGAYFLASKSVTARIIHSTPLWLLAEFGVVGTTIFATPIFRIAFAELKRLRTIDTAGKLMLLIIASFGIMSLVHELLYQRMFWLLLGAAMACRIKTSTPKLTKTSVTHV